MRNGWIEAHGRAWLAAERVRFCTLCILLACMALFLGWVPASAQGKGRLRHHRRAIVGGRPAENCHETAVFADRRADVPFRVGTTRESAVRRSSRNIGRSPGTALGQSPTPVRRKSRAAATFPTVALGEMARARTPAPETPSLGMKHARAKHLCKRTNVSVRSGCVPTPPFLRSFDDLGLS
jgi:hypothetical protein